MGLIHYIDYPPAGHDCPDPDETIIGWVSSTRPINAIVIESATQQDHAVRLIPRADVEQANRRNYQYHTGFQSSVTIRKWLGDSDDVKLCLRVESTDNRHDTIPLAITTARRRKLLKRAKILPLLVCPKCRCSLETKDAFRQCGKCGDRYEIGQNSVNCLPKSFRDEFGVVATRNVSSWNYDPRILSLIEQHPDKLFLDCGAGYRTRYYDNVINFEIVDYPSTDVLGVGEKLPFADNAIDGVFSVAVLEHVKDPFLCAKEIMRILKPGGVLFCAAAFLQPVHAFPHHYYNMTALGLETLFEGMNIRERDVPLSLHPMKAITWMLRTYANGLPQSVRNTFLQMTVENVLSHDVMERWHQDSLVQELQRESWPELACGNVIVAYKP